MKATVHECKWMIEGEVASFRSFTIEFDENECYDILSGHVGGLIDVCHIDGKDIVVNDEGLLLNMPLNPWAKAQDMYLVGTIIECEGRLT